MERKKNFHKNIRNLPTEICHIETKIVQYSIKTHKMLYPMHLYYTYPMYCHIFLKFC